MQISGRVFLNVVEIILKTLAALFLWKIPTHLAPFKKWNIRVLF